MKTTEDHGQFAGPGELRFVRTLPGPIERVWDYLTDPEKRSRWFAGGPMEQRQGGKFTLKFRHANLVPDETPPEHLKECQDPGFSMDGVVLRWEPPRVLSYTFGETQESQVTFELTPQGKDVLLVLTHRATGEDLTSMSGFAAGWHTHLVHLAAQLSGSPRPAFWPIWTKLRAEYGKMRGE